MRKLNDVNYDPEFFARRVALNNLLQNQRTVIMADRKSAEKNRQKKRREERDAKLGVYEGH